MSESLSEDGMEDEEEDKEEDEGRTRKEVEGKEGRCLGKRRKRLSGESKLK